jgi:molecular chaperone GrpE
VGDSENKEDQEEVLSLTGEEDLSLEETIQKAQEAVAAAPAKGGSDTHKSGSTALAELAALKVDLAEKAMEVQQTKQRYLYILADFENYKKRAQKEQADHARFSNERLIKEMLVVLDDFERAILHARETDDFKTIREGLDLIKKQFVSFLTRFGVTTIDSLRKPFDPTYHQAVGVSESSDLPPDHVAEEAQKGYLLHDRVIRPSMVIISKKSAQ